MRRIMQASEYELAAERTKARRMRMTADRRAGEGYKYTLYCIQFIHSEHAQRILIKNGVAYFVGDGEGVEKAQLPYRGVPWGI